LPGPDGWPQAYEYSAAGSTVRFNQNATLPPILHLTLFNPLDDHYGQSPLEAAAITIDTHNAAACWNKALLDNAARPSGALVYAGAECCRLRNTSVLKRSLRTFIRGRETQDARSYSKAGSTGDLYLPHATWISWRRNMPPPARSHWPSEFHRCFWGFMATIHILTIRKPTECFGGRPCCRSAGRIGCALTHWLAPVFGEGLLLSADIDKIEALSADRTALWERVSKAPFLSVNEKRLAAGYGPIDGGDMFLRQ
jgi:phage portal protein BeeE